jgi:hypothetical protein
VIKYILILNLFFCANIQAQKLNEKEIKSLKDSVMNYGISENEVLIDENGDEVKFNSTSNKDLVIDLWAT